MRAGGKSGPARMQTSPPAYLKHQGSAGPRLSPTFILFILWRASLPNPSILLIQSIRKLHLPPVTPCNLTCRLSRPHPGNDNHLILCLSYSCFCTNLLTFSAQAKLSKRAKKSNPVEEPVLAEPNASASEPPSAPAPETTAPTEQQAMESSDNPEIPSSAQPADDPDVVITRTEYVEPGRPTVLARCSAKEELLERHRARLDITDYTNLSIGDIVSGYIGQVHNSRDLEIDMLKQIQQKSEVQLSCLLHSHPYHAIPQVYYL
jgi:hypothetical protein